MANPQKENGNIQIATEIWEHLTKIRIPGEVRQVLDFILRKTYGWNKKSDKIALSQFVENTGLKKNTICKCLAKLQGMNLISITQLGNEIAKTYSFIKDFDTWKPLPKKGINKGKVLVGRKNVKDLKKEIRLRDKNICRVCGYDGNTTNEKLPVHHIDFNQSNNNNDNLIALCKSDHAKAHNNNEDYKNYLKNLITKKGNTTKVLPNTGTVIPQHRNTSLPNWGTTIDTNTIDTTKDNGAMPPDEINLLLDFFKKTVNPHINFGNKTERKACFDLLKAYGLEKIKTSLLFLEEKRKTDKFLPIITTPYELWTKWAKIKQHLTTNKRKIWLRK